MRRTTAVLGAGLSVGALGVALVSTGVVGASLAVLVAPVLVAPPLGTPPAAAAGLRPFEGCEELRRWYVDEAMPHVGPWGLGGPPVVYGMRTAAGAVEADSAAGVSDAVGSGATGTNVQEAGVDEPDLAKTDGSLVVHVDGPFLVVTDVSGEKPRELSRLPLPRALGAPELLLVGDRAVVLGQPSGYLAGPGGGGLMLDRSILPEPSSTRALVVDLGDPTAPAVVHDATYGGGLVSARQYGDVVRLVVSRTTPAIDFVYPDRVRTEREATRENRRLLRESTVDDWLPRVSTGDPGAVTGQPVVRSTEQRPDRPAAGERLMGCDAVEHPEAGAGFGTVSVVTFRADDPAARRTTGVTASGETVYSSADRLYLATTDQGWGWWGVRDSLVAGEPARVRRPPLLSTRVHAFDLDGLSTRYVASGRVRGLVVDRWSMSEHDGNLRVATALGRDSWTPRENAVTVLAERGDRLTEVGRVDGLGVDEQIQSVRWFGDLAVVVTFRRTDPLYAVDLADPEAPRVLGALKIPGFSSYLHPVGDGLLLGLGQHANRQGVSRFAQAAVFDLRDLARPDRVDTEAFGEGAEFTAAWDPRGFTYLPERRTVLATLQDYRHGRSRLVVMGLGEDGTLAPRSSTVVAGWDALSVRTLPLDDGRVAVVARGEVDLLTL